MNKSNKEVNEKILEEQKGNTKHFVVPMPAFFLLSFSLFAFLVTLGLKNIKQYKISQLSQSVLTQQTQSNPPKVSLTTQAPIPTVPIASSSARPLMVSVKKNVGRVNIRQKPSTTSAKIGTAKGGQEFEFMSKSQDWYGVKSMGGLEGFIHAQYIMEETTL